MSKYLYGASVQGIQGYIFATNELKSIVGASEIVKQINETDASNMSQISFFKYFKPEEILLNAAGNIKVVFNSKEACQKAVLQYPKIVMQNAVGISISQAVVEFDGEASSFIHALESKLKIQRNKSAIPMDLSISIIKQHPKTARPAICIDQDLATKQKKKAYDIWLNNAPRNKEFKELSAFSNVKNKIAIIHIDGNGLGQLVPKLGSKLSGFSAALNTATRQAFENARDDSMDIREVVLGGDDVTVICNADNALKFTKKFLESFEKETSKIKELEGIRDNLTACAGIAYANEKYPFYYAVGLAEELCGVAKNHSNREHSCLMFHNIQSSHFQNWDKFVEDELTISNEAQIIRCDFGAYYLNKNNEAKIEDFMHTVEAYRCEGSPISRLRNWLSELYKSDKNAKLLLDRINKITKEKAIWNCEVMNKNLKYLNKDLSNDTLVIDKDGYRKTPIYDILQIISITETK